jgi:hypothetical protein
VSGRSSILSDPVRSFSRQHRNLEPSREKLTPSERDGYVTNDVPSPSVADAEFDALSSALRFPRGCQAGDEVQHDTIAGASP